MQLAIRRRGLSHLRRVRAYRTNRRGADAAAVAAAVRKYFAYVPDSFEVVRSQTVGRAVAVALGCKWSPPLARLCQAALLEMGCKLLRYDNRSLVACCRPQHFDRADAVRLSMQLRNRKTPPKDVPGVELP